MKARIKSPQYGVMKFIGHLDVMRFFQKVMSRADIPIAFSGGFSPHMIMSFANPLGVGVTSDGEYFDIELVEQPVKARDFEGMKKVKDNVNTIIMADESCFSPEDARKLLEMKAADVLNIKLMKCGGIYKALQIIEIAEEFGVECMLGCMVESKISLTAAAHLAAAKKTITRVDLDAAILLKEDPVIGGFNKDIPWFSLSDAPGLGITDVIGMKEI